MKPIVHLNHSPKAVEFLRMYVGEDVYISTLDIALCHLDLAVFRLTSRKEMRYYEVNENYPFVLLSLSDGRDVATSLAVFKKYFERRRALA